MSSEIRYSDTLEEIIAHAGTWEDDARLLGNLRAGDITNSIQEALRIIYALGDKSEI